jgi:hypothetical protein
MSAAIPGGMGVILFNLYLQNSAVYDEMERDDRFVVAPSFVAILTPAKLP